MDPRLSLGVDSGKAHSPLLAGIRCVHQKFNHKGWRCKTHLFRLLRLVSCWIAQLQCLLRLGHYEVRAAPLSLDTSSVARKRGIDSYHVCHAG